MKYTMWFKNVNLGRPAKMIAQFNSIGFAEIFMNRVELAPGHRWELRDLHNRLIRVREK